MLGYGILNCNNFLGKILCICYILEKEFKIVKYFKLKTPQ